MAPTGKHQVYSTDLLSCLYAPTESWSMYRSIPVADQFIIEPQQGNRTTGHFKRGNVATYERTGDSDISAAQNLRKFVSYDVQLHQRCTTHAINKSKDTLARF